MQVVERWNAALADSRPSLQSGGNGRRPYRGRMRHVVPTPAGGRLNPTRKGFTLAPSCTDSFRPSISRAWDDAMAEVECEDLTAAEFAVLAAIVEIHESGRLGSLDALCRKA